MRLEHLFISGFLIFMMFGLALSFYADVLNNYNVDDNYADDFRLINDKSDEVYSASKELKDKTQESAVSDEDAEDEMLSGMQAGIRSKPYTAADLINQNIHTYGKQVGVVPPSVLKTLGVIIIILTIFAVLYFLRGIPQR